MRSTVAGGVPTAILGPSTAYGRRRNPAGPVAAEYRRQWATAFDAT
ncbi:MAG: hypothetical protein ACRD0P_10585 [Stackebrandtia sp.]